MNPKFNLYDRVRIVKNPKYFYPQEIQSYIGQETEITNIKFSVDGESVLYYTNVNSAISWYEDTLEFIGNDVSINEDDVMHLLKE